MSNVVTWITINTSHVVDNIITCITQLTGSLSVLSTCHLGMYHDSSPVIQ